MSHVAHGRVVGWANAHRSPAERSVGHGFRQVMKRTLWRLFCGLVLLVGVARAAMPPAVLSGLAADDSDEKIAAIQALASAEPESALVVLEALAKDLLMLAGGRLLIVDGESATDAANGAKLAKVPDDAEAVTLNNRVRRELESTLAGLRLFAPDAAVRREAEKELASGAGPASLPWIERALAQVKDPAERAQLELARARASLGSEDAKVRLSAVMTLAGSADPSVRALVAARLVKDGEQYVDADPAVRAAATDALRQIDRRLGLGDSLARVFSGVSLGSILLLAALGLAITYGVMGVINMAHGELLMVGAYATYLTQGWFRAYLPDHVDWYVLAAIPLAFLAAAVVGAVIERLVIRHLYGRTLETLLASWGVSLILIQAIRVVFGPQNMELSNPVWMSGGVELMPGLVLPWNRIVIVLFALIVLAGISAVMIRTRLGLYIRAVTQNRAMAGCVGVPTRRIDTLAFAIGAGIAGLGGVALSQIGNVGPDMGQGYIVDSFLVVVVGGVGQLAGAVLAALGLGIATKFLEGLAGAVVAKILVLVFIILFIQKRPQGLFALKGRFVEN